MTHSLDTQKQLRAASKELMSQKVLRSPPDLKSSLGVEGQRREFQLEEVGEAGGSGEIENSNE